MSAGVGWRAVLGSFAASQTASRACVEACERRTFPDQHVVFSGDRDQRAVVADWTRLRNHFL